MDKKKEAEAIKRFQSFANDAGYIVNYSGGKDSDVIRILAELSCVKHILLNKHTTVDAPETVRYIRSIPNIRISYPKRSMWQLIVDKRMPPTRLVRYCCNELKETTTDIEKGKICVTGVRWAESNNRKDNQSLIGFQNSKGNKTLKKLAEETDANLEITKKGYLVLNDDNDASRRMVEQCFRTRKTMLNPIIDWTDADVWEFLNHYGCESNPLYQCGYHRIGCIGCPMANKRRYREFERYPKYKENYIKAFQRMQDKKIDDGLQAFENANGIMNGQKIFDWWMGEDTDQLKIDFDELGEEYE